MKNTYLYNQYRRTNYKIPSITVIDNRHNNTDIRVIGTKTKLSYNIKGIDLKKFRFTIDVYYEYLHFKLATSTTDQLSKQIFPSIAATYSEYLKHNAQYELNIEDSDVDNLYFELITY